MKRRRFIEVIAGGVLAVPLAAEAQPAGKVYRVGLVFALSPVSQMAGPYPVHPLARAFLHEMNRLGYGEGRNLVFEPRSAEGKFERSGDIVAELLRLKIDVIVTAGNDLSREAKRVTNTVPIVMASGRSPVEAGLVASLARPGANITGFSMDAGPEIEAKRLELLKEALPRVSRVAFLGTKADWEQPLGKGAQAAARALGVVLLHAETTPGQYNDAFTMLTRKRPDALFVANSPSNYGQRDGIADFAVKSRLPGIYPFREIVEAGGLMSYGTSLTDLYRRAAGYVDRILQGAKPADLPIEQPSKFEFVINLKTAKALGLSIPPSVLQRADEVIQ
jgi:putative ABC transport system substrate-binding protein